MQSIRSFLRQREIPEVFDCQRHVDVLVDQLHRFTVAVHQKRGAQNVMSGGDALCSAERQWSASKGFDGETHNVVIQRIARTVFVEDHPDLQHRERICVFDIRRQVAMVTAEQRKGSCNSRE